MRTTRLTLCLLFALPAAFSMPQDSRRQARGFEKQLQPVAFLVGKHQGQGKSAMGTYRETMSASWAVDHTAIVLQSASTAGGAVVFQDLRVFTWDQLESRIRVHQFARGGVCTYTARVEGSKVVGGKVEGSKVVLEQDGLEGLKRPEWRYTLKQEKDGFSYQVEQKSGDEFRGYVAGTLERQ